MAKKDYFAEPSAAYIVRHKEPTYAAKKDELANRILSLQDNQYLVIPIHSVPLIPRQYPNPKKFLKHGSFVQVKTPRSIDEAVESHILPWILRREAFDAVASMYHSGYSFRPIQGYRKDQRERRVRLVELCEALRILSYGTQTSNDIIIEKVYLDSKRASKDGATVSVSVPSRSYKQPRYRFRMNSVVIDSNDPHSYVVANGFLTDIHFLAKSLAFRFNYYDDKEDSYVVNIFAPEIAAYYRLMMDELHRQHKPNKSVAEMSPFGIPTNLTVDYYKRILSRVLVVDPKLKGKSGLRKPNKAEQEVLLWALIKEKKYEQTFFRKISRDGSMKDLDWKLSA